MKMLQWFIPFMLCLSMGGCSDSNETATGHANQADTGVANSDSGSVSCTQDADCASGRVCESGLCELGCGAMSECPDGYECVNGRLCRMAQPCQADAECGGGVCDCNGFCQELPSEPCSTDLQCDVQDFCDTCRGACSSRAAQCEPCRSDAECAANAKCRSPSGSAVASIAGVESAGVCLRQCQGSCDLLGPGYLCVASGENTQVCAPESGSCGSLLECTADVDCGPTEFCNDRRRCQPGCSDDTECPAGTLCQGVRCAPPCDEASNPCPADQRCDADGRCGIENGCASSADCPMPETYCDRNTLRCVSGCEVDNDCQNAAQQCVSGSCRERGCSGNYQCAFGQVCDITTAQCLEAEGRHCEAGCDPMTEGSCGASAMCVSLQDQDGNALGDFCFEACLQAPNECPQGYQCVEFEDQGMGMSGGPTGSYCLRDCTYNPVSD